MTALNNLLTGDARGKGKERCQVPGVRCQGGKDRCQVSGAGDGEYDSRFKIPDSRRGGASDSRFKIQDSRRGRQGKRDAGHDREKESWFGRLAACYHRKSRRERVYGKRIC
jgi:hypothetical protein